VKRCKCLYGDSFNCGAVVVQHSLPSSAHHGDLRQVKLNQDLVATIDADQHIAVRVASFNVELGKNATSERIGQVFNFYKLDIIRFDDAHCFCGHAIGYRVG